MNISQISKKYGLSLDTLRFYEKCGVLVPERLTNGYRSYQEIHEQKIKLIICLKNIGFTLEEIKQLIELGTKPPSEECNIISNQLIDKKIELISQQIKLFEYGKDTLQEVKKYIKDNSFVKNQDKIQDMIETLYKLSKN
ncbi:MerR family transcriptional regulator [Acinetobacter sp. ABJ_C4_1]|uniref:MerR family transcriptional regulator n=1 Tax=Acinetobacter sp. ABJ_C4_1 TaxID=3377080 RepID=UPI0037C7A1EF